MPTPLESSSDGEYSTPATSKFPTPAANDASAGPSASSIEVHIPARAHDQADFSCERNLHNSIYSLNARPNKSAAVDSDNEKELSVSFDAQLAQRLQQEEVTEADVTLAARGGPRRRSGRFSTSGPSSPAPLPTSLPRKRGRASAGSISKQAPPAKKTRVIADSDAPSESNIDVGEEVAAAALMYSNDLSGAMLSADESTLADSEEDKEEEAFDSESDIEPLSVKKGKQPAKTPESSFAGSDESDGDDDSDSQSEDEPLANKKGKRPSRKSVSKAGSKVKAKGPAARNNSGNASVPNSGPAPHGPDGLQGAGHGHVAGAPADSDSTDSEDEDQSRNVRRIANNRRGFRAGNSKRLEKERGRLERHHPELATMWTTLEDMPSLNAGMIQQPQAISRQLKPFQLEGVAWMKKMEKTELKGGLLGDEMGLGKTIQAVTLIMSDYPAKQPSLVLVPPVALMQWQSEIQSYTDGTLKTFVYHGTNSKAKGITTNELKKYNVIMMSYNSLESMYRKQEKGFKRKNGLYKEKSVIHAIHFHRVILDEAHCIKTRTTMTAKACFALETDYRWCLTGTPLQNRIGEFFSLIRFLNIQPFASYLCKQCSCSSLEWAINDDNRCKSCHHAGMQHVSVFNQELLNPIQKFGNFGPGREAFRKLRLMTERIMLRRLKKDHTDSMELPVKEVYVDRQFFGEEENDFANSIMTNGQRKFETYVAQGVLLNNYANIFGLIMQMRQVADHPDLILKKNCDGGQNVLNCSICDEPAEDTVRSRCKHDFCRACVSSYVRSTDEPDCPRCHIPLSIDLEQPEIEQDEKLVKKNSIINRIKMEKWTSSSKIELLVHQLHQLRSDNATHKSIIFSQFTTMLQLIEWRLRRAGITTVMLDGSMTPAQRQASIEHFMNNVGVECFLVSLKAGGVALNLTEASQVFIVDPWAFPLPHGPSGRLLAHRADHVPQVVEPGG